MPFHSKRAIDLTDPPSCPVRPFDLVQLAVLGVRRIVPNALAFPTIRRDRHTAACWTHGRSKFFDLARLSKALMSAELVRRIDALFAIEPQGSGARASGT